MVAQFHDVDKDLYPVPVYAWDKFQKATEGLEKSQMPKDSTLCENLLSK